MDSGFGASFWGFFVLAAAWCVAYFAWAVAANRRDEERDRHRAGLEGIGRTSPGHRAGGPPGDDEGSDGNDGGGCEAASGELGRAGPAGTSDEKR